MYSVPKLEDFSPASLDAAAGNCLRRSMPSPGPHRPKAFEEFRNRWMARKNGLLCR